MSVLEGLVAVSRLRLSVRDIDKGRRLVKEFEEKRKHSMLEE